MSVANRQTTPPYSWGAGCTGWRLVDTPGLTVIEEEMPPGTAEIPHLHKVATQVFYGLSGQLTLTLAGQTSTLGPGDALRIPPGTAHEVRNPGSEAARFLVISTPSTAEDRIAVPMLG
ncbi:cupin domain-containing protein [Dinoroseobacter sp. S76]|uniref:cupin domain-containing protein n=1 Tax=Dinoroseobacter sp. S76 TaxID=3415124 RepID=UPI003C7E22C1